MTLYRVGETDGEIQTVAILEEDFETPRRKRRLSVTQPLDWVCVASWAGGGLLLTAWAVLLYLAVKAVMEAI
jgi:hypothetical protein